MPAIPRLRTRSMLQTGITLVELLVVLALVAVLLGFGAPSLARALERTRIATGAQRLQAHLSLARSEAVRRGLRVTVCVSSDGQTCAGAGGWEQGWIVFTDAGASGQPSAPPLAAAPALPTLVATGNGSVARYVSFTEVGQPQLLAGGFQAGTIRVCGAPGSEGRDLVLSRAGRLRNDLSTAPCS